MYKIINNSKRDFIVPAAEVVKGGKIFSEEKIQKDGDGKTLFIRPAEVRISQGEAVSVLDKLGETIKGYAGVLVVEHIKEPEAKKGKK